MDLGGSIGRNEIFRIQVQVQYWYNFGEMREH